MLCHIELKRIIFVVNLFGLDKTIHDRTDLCLVENLSRNTTYLYYIYYMLYIFEILYDQTFKQVNHLKNLKSLNNI